MIKIENNWKNAFFIFLVIVMTMMGVIAGFRGMGVSFGFTQSASVNHIMYKLTTPQPSHDFTQGEWVSFPYPESTGRSGQVIKRVLGREGDVILVKEDNLYMNGVLILKLKSHTSKGVPLDHIPNQTIPSGFLFVAGDIADSYDSRYSNFGLISESDIISLGSPIW